MNTAEQILVITLALALAVFLALAIAIAIQLLKLIKTLNEISLKAQEFVNSAEHAADLLKNAVGQLSLMRFAHSIFDMVHRRSKKNSNKEE